MAEESKLILNKVVIVGKLRNPEDKTPIEASVTGKDLAIAIKAKFKFERDTEIAKEGLDLGLKNGKFFLL